MQAMPSNIYTITVDISLGESGKGSDLGEISRNLEC
jgi:hypothetical protein